MSYDGTAVLGLKIEALLDRDKTRILVSLLLFLPSLPSPFLLFGEVYPVVHLIVHLTLKIHLIGSPCKSSGGYSSGTLLLAFLFIFLFSFLFVSIVSV